MILLLTIVNLIFGGYPQDEPPWRKATRKLNSVIRTQWVEPGGLEKFLKKNPEFIQVWKKSFSSEKPGSVSYPSEREEIKLALDLGLVPLAHRLVEEEVSTTHPYGGNQELAYFEISRRNYQGAMEHFKSHVAQSKGSWQLNDALDKIKLLESPPENLEAEIKFADTLFFKSQFVNPFKYRLGIYFLQQVLLPQSKFPFPKQTQAWVILHRAFIKLEEKEQAREVEEYYRSQAPQIDENLGKIYFEAGIYTADKNQLEALEYFKKAVLHLEGRELFGRALFNYALTLKQSGNNDLAIQNFKRLILSDVNDGDSGNNLMDLTLGYRPKAADNISDILEKKQLISQAVNFARFAARLEDQQPSGCGNCGMANRSMHFKRIENLEKNLEQKPLLTTLEGVGYQNDLVGYLPESNSFNFIKQYYQRWNLIRFSDLSKILKVPLVQNRTEQEVQKKNWAVEEVCRLLTKGAITYSEFLGIFIPLLKDKDNKENLSLLPIGQTLSEYGFSSFTFQSFLPIARKYKFLKQFLLVFQENRFIRDKNEKRFIPILDPLETTLQDLGKPGIIPKAPRTTILETCGSLMALADSITREGDNFPGEFLKESLNKLIFNLAAHLIIDSFPPKNQVEDPYDITSAFKKRSFALGYFEDLTISERILKEFGQESLVRQVLKYGDTACFEQLLDRIPIKPNKEEGRQFLWDACYQGDFEFFKSVSEKIGNLEQVDKGGNTFIHYICDGFQNRNPDKFLEFALKQGLDPNARNLKGETPLHLCMKDYLASKTAILIAHRADPNLSDKEGNTPAHLAVKERRKEHLAVLKKSWCLLNVLNNQDESPLVIAVKQWDKETVTLLLKLGADPWFKTRRGHVAMDYLNNSAVIEPLLVNGAVWTAHAATFMKKSKVLEYLHQMNPTLINNKNAYGQTALHLSTGSIGVGEMTKTLLDLGADVNARDDSGETPLHKTCWYSSLEQTKMLLEKEPDLLLKNNRGDTAIDVAFKSVNQERATLELLVSHLVKKGLPVPPAHLIHNSRY